MKKGRNRLKVENAVALCENGFGYDVAMIVASMADLVEELDPVLFDELGRLQRIIKCGLSSMSAVGFYEAGFADRVVAKALADATPYIVVDKGTAKATVELAAAEIDATLATFPSYFEVIARELRQ